MKIGKHHVMLGSALVSFAISLLAIRLSNTNMTVAKITKSGLAAGA